AAAAALVACNAHDARGPTAMPHASAKSAAIHEPTRSTNDDADEGTPVPVEVALADDAAERFHGRVRLAKDSLSSWTRRGLEGDAISSTHATGDLVVVQVARDAVRIRVEGRSMRALAWVRRRDLIRMPAKRTTLATAVDRAADERAGVTLLPGASVE